MLHCGFYNRKICLYIAGLQRVIGIWRKKKRDFFLFSQCTDRVCFCPWICSTVKCNAAGTSKGKSVSQRCEQDAFSFYIMSGSISGSDNCTDAFGNKENAAIGIPVDILQSLFCLFISKLKSLLHFCVITLDILREGSIGYSENLIPIMSGKTACIIQEWFVSSIADSRENYCQFWGAFIIFPTNIQLLCLLYRLV